MSKPTVRLAIGGNVTIADIQGWLKLDLYNAPRIGGVEIIMQEPPFADPWHGPYREDWNLKLEFRIKQGFEYLEYALAFEIMFEYFNRPGAIFLLSGDDAVYLFWKDSQCKLSQTGLNKFSTLVFLPGKYSLEDLPVLECF